MFLDAAARWRAEITLITLKVRRAGIRSTEALVSTANQLARIPAIARRMRRGFTGR